MTLERHDFIALEKAVVQAYLQFKLGTSVASRHDLFVSIKNLAYSVLIVGDWGKYGVDYEKVSYEYSLYMFERIVTSTFSPPLKFAWTEYVRKSIRYGVMAVKNEVLWFDFIEKMEGEEFSEALKDVVVEEEDSAICKIDEERLGKKIHAGLRVFYTQKEINRLYPLASDLICSGKNKSVPDDIPVDLQDFIKVLICVGKRLDEVEDIKFSLDDISPKTLRKAMNVAVRSTLFLAASVKLNYFPRDLLLSLDLHSLYRLLSIRGKTSIRLPSLRSLEKLIGAVITASNMLLEGKSYKEALESAREELDFSIEEGSVKKMVSKIIESYQLFENGKESDPLLDIMVSALNVLKNLASKVPKLIDQGASPDSVLRVYKEMYRSIDNLTNSLVKISSTYSSSSIEKLMSERKK